MERDTDSIVKYNTVVLRKNASRKLPDGKADEQILALKARVESPGRINRGWRVKTDAFVISDVPSEFNRSGGKKAVGGYIYRVTMHIDCHPDAPRGGIDNEFRNIVSLLVAASNSWPSWQVELVNDMEWSSPELDKIKESGDTDYVGYAAIDLPGNWRDYFSNIYDREAQITIVMSALEAALESDFRNRFHGALIGPPACGKTELLRVLTSMCGADAVMVLDGTATTQAGLTKELAEREELPRVIIVEEIEKAEEGALRVLLGLLDTRGEIRKVTAREKISRDCRILAFCTVNNVERFETLLSGALASRFAHHVFCPRPDRKLMERILKREVEHISGDARWINPCLDYMEEIGSDDPRKAIALCLSGRDRWLDGTYADMLNSIRRIRDDVRTA